MSIMDMFTQNTATAQQSAQLGAPIGQTIPALPANAPVDLAQQAADAAAAKAQEDQFKDFWKPVEVDPALQNQPVTGFTMDPAKINEAVSKANFLGTMTDAQREAIAAGGEGATKVMMEVMNNVGRTVMAQSTMAQGRMMEQAIKTAKADILSQLPDAVRNSLTKNEIFSNEKYNNPEFSPVVDAVRSQMQTKFPNASVAEITNLTQQYLDKFAGNIGNQQQSQQTAKQGKTEEDWSKFLQG